MVMNDYSRVLAFDGNQWSGILVKLPQAGMYQLQHEKHKLCGEKKDKFQVREGDELFVSEVSLCSEGLSLEAVIGTVRGAVELGGIIVVVLVARFLMEGSASRQKQLGPVLDQLDDTELKDGSVSCVAESIGFVTFIQKGIPDLVRSWVGLSHPRALPSLFSELTQITPLKM
jgi:hypothetical protein